MLRTVMRNFHISYPRAVVPYALRTPAVELPVMSTLPVRMRHSTGLRRRESERAAREAKLFLPVAWFHEQTLAQRAMSRLAGGGPASGTAPPA
ncbi:hypothetical protein AB0I51_19090 [Streptomyces sp. NPDC050549]|uniref:hypothetical protein n=1 Tax=Streptomyces sp. NPDC050549 TaxID=3155406 RepID=UPI003442C95C